MSLDVRQVRERIVRPALAALGAGLGGEAAELLLLGTAAAESGFRNLAQVGGGPALGLWQMEPATFRDHMSWLRAQPDLRIRVLAACSRGSGEGDPPADELVWNLRLAAMMARLHYWRRPGAIPQSRDPRDLGAYWKQHYNTPLGRGTVDHFVASWHRHVAAVV